MPYKLSATLKAHTSDVRSVGSPTDQLILSASRDSTAIAWKRSESSSAQFSPEVTLKDGSTYVNAVAYLPPTPDAPKGYAITGGRDAVIKIFNLQSSRDEPEFCLVGHSENICALDITPAGTIISGSWDRTAKVWQNHTLVFDLKSHQQSVWAVLVIEEDQFLTGSADKTIKLWQQHKVVHTYTGHKDAVRGLAKIPDVGFASCSNDSEIHVWTIGGDIVYTLSGHTSFVYSLSVLPNGDMVSAGEDRTVRIWKDGELSQTIVHPAISVWSVSTMPNGDIVSGCSDGVVRVFSKQEERWAPAEVLKGYDDTLASQALPSQQVGDINKEQLQGTESLNIPGKKEGEVKMIRNGPIVEAYTWDSQNNKWQKIGEVVDAVGSSRKQLYQGKEYDYVFDVDIKDNAPPLKLPYNASENPYNAAQRFLQNNDLPMTYLDDVVKFIEKNSSGVNIGAGEEYVDPFTGASRYRATSTSGSGEGRYMDPFTGASRYVASPASGSSAPSGSDPRMKYTSTSQAAAASTPTSTVAKIIPAMKAVSINQVNVTLMRSKLFQLDEAFRHEISTSSIAMYPKEITLLEEIFTYLTVVTTPPAPSKPPALLTAAHIEAIIAILERWPSSQRFPLIDLSRLVFAFCPKGPFDVARLKAKFIDALFVATGWAGQLEEGSFVPVGKVKETNMTLLLKALANAVGEWDGGAEAIEAEWLSKVVEIAEKVPYSRLVKAQKVAFATVLFNISCRGRRLESSIRDHVVALIVKILGEEKAETEAVYRTLVGLGNLAYAAKTLQQPLSPLQSGEIKKTVSWLPQQFSDSRVQNVCSEVLVLML